MHNPNDVADGDRSGGDYHAHDRAFHVCLPSPVCRDRFAQTVLETINLGAWSTQAGNLALSFNWEPMRSSGLKFKQADVPCRNILAKMAWSNVET